MWSPCSSHRPPNQQSLLKRRAVAFATLKKTFSFLNPDQVAALCLDVSEVRLQRGELLVAEGTEVTTPSLYIVESGQLECTCEGGTSCDVRGRGRCCWWHLDVLSHFAPPTTSIPATVTNTTNNGNDHRHS
jgi:hypothetical protein